MLRIYAKTGLCLSVTIALLVLGFVSGCNQSNQNIKMSGLVGTADADSAKGMTAANDSFGKGALLLTRFTSYEQLNTVVQIEYFDGFQGEDDLSHCNPMVRITHRSSGRKVISVLKAFSISEGDFIRARDGDLWDKLWLGLNSPYAVINRKELQMAFTFSRRRDRIFGVGDVAFFDLAETTVSNINEDELSSIPPEDLSEKGYLNTFNHITSQSFITSLFSERLADFISDAHERHKMPLLISGKFSEDQILDLENGPVDNYVDLVNNEWGQEIGKVLEEKYNIRRKTFWTPELLANYLNDLQSYYSTAFQIGFKPFRPSDEVVIRFSKKINRVLKDVSGMIKND